MTRPCTCDRCTIGGPHQKGECVLCWHFYNTPKYQELWGGLEVPKEVGPGLISKMGNFLGAVAKHVATGMQYVTQEEYEERLRVCGGCEWFVDNHCKKCGCRVAGDVVAKGRWRSQTCPLGKWPLVTSPPA